MRNDNRVKKVFAVLGLGLVGGSGLGVLNPGELPLCPLIGRGVSGVDGRHSKDGILVVSTMSTTL